jgi:hypothetical protein
MSKNAANKRVCGSVSWWLSAKPYGLTFGRSVWAESYRSGTSFNPAAAGYTGIRKSATYDFDLLVSYQITNIRRFSLAKILIPFLVATVKKNKDKM